MEQHERFMRRAIDLASRGTGRVTPNPMVGAVVGYMLPGMFVSRRMFLRKKQIQNGLPDALDLLIVSLEAGLGLDQAILKCAEELAIAYPALSNELQLINIETRAGKPRLEALKNFAKRTQVDDVRALVAMLVQTDRFGLGEEVCAPRTALDGIPGTRLVEVPGDDHRLPLSLNQNSKCLKDIVRVPQAAAAARRRTPRERPTRFVLRPQRRRAGVHTETHHPTGGT